MSLFSSTTVFSWPSKKLRTIILVFLSDVCSILTHFWKVLVVAVKWQNFMLQLTELSTFFGKLSISAHMSHSVSLSYPWELCCYKQCNMEEVLHKLCSSLAYIGCNFDCNSMANILHIIYKSYSLFQLKISQSYTYIYMCIYVMRYQHACCKTSRPNSRASHTSNLFPESVKITLSVL